MKYPTFLLAIIALFAFSTLARATCINIGCQNEYIDILYVTASGSIYIGTSGVETLSNCQPVGGVYFTLNPSSPNAKYIYATLLTAQAARKKTFVRISELSVGCTVSYVTIQ